MGTHSAVLLRALLGVTVIMVQIVLRLAFLATATFAAPAADADADPFYGLAPYAHVAPIVHHVVLVCKVVPKTVVVGKQCHAEPECTTAPVVVGKKITGHEDPVCEEVEVPAVAYGHHGLVGHVVGKRDADAEPFYGLAYGAALPVAHTVKTKHCTPGAPILEDISHDVTTCVPKQVCADVSA